MKKVFLPPLLRNQSLSASLCVVKLCQIFIPPTVFLWSSRNLAHMIYVPIRKKTVEQIFEILLLKFLANF